MVSEIVFIIKVLWWWKVLSKSTCSGYIFRFILCNELQWFTIGHHTLKHISILAYYSGSDHVQINISTKQWCVPSAGKVWKDLVQWFGRSRRLGDRQTYPCQMKLISTKSSAKKGVAYLSICVVWKEGFVDESWRFKFRELQVKHGRSIGRIVRRTEVAASQVGGSRRMNSSHCHSLYRFIQCSLR